MASLLKRTLLRPVPYLFSDRIGNGLTKLFSRRLRQELCGTATDKFLELLLRGMDLSFCLSRGYRRNIRDFEGGYLFQTADNVVVAAATFANGDMRVHENAIDKWDARVTFKDAAALQAFLFSKDQDILDSVLRNDVEVDGNLNYIHKFAFMARDLMRRLGVA